MNTPQREDLLILTKTYPTPSKRYRETSCVCAVNRQGTLRRLYPVPFRFLDGKQQFHRWEWISAEIHKASSDSRPESYRINTDTIVRNGNVLNTRADWAERRAWYEPHIVDSATALEERRHATKETFGVLGPVELLGLDVEPEKESEWTEEDIARLTKEGFFDTAEVQARPLLKKIPYAFRYRYRCLSDPRGSEERHKITDWEVGALYLNCTRRYGTGWESKFREKIEQDFAQQDLHLLMGTVNNHPHRWMIIGLIYPPRRKTLQLSLFPGQDGQ